jgi:hypothetical protein
MFVSLNGNGWWGSCLFCSCGPRTISTWN